MSSFMSRGGYEFWVGKKCPKEIAYLHKDITDKNWIAVTYKELLDEKRKKQEFHLLRVRAEETVKPCFIWVFYNSGFPYAGWWLYVKTVKKDFSIGFRGANKEFIPKIMEIFPLGYLPLEENFDSWAKEFERTYHRPAFGRKKNGLAQAYIKIKNGEIVEVMRGKEYAES